MVEVIKRFVPTFTVGDKLYAKGLHRNAYVGMAGLNSATEIAVHQTGNTSRGADAEVHGRLQTNGNTRIAGWQYSVDDKIAVQSFPHTARVYHTGSTHGHKNSIGVEICINSDGDYKKSLENGAALVRQIMKEENISIMNVKQHFDYSGKNCPAQIRAGKDGVNWNDFIQMVLKEEDKEVEVVMSGDLYRVQVGAFASKENAERLAAELKTKGYPVFIPDANTVTVSASKPAPAPKPKPVAIKAGDRVLINSSASKYATGETIPTSRKKPAYTVMQATSDRVLLKEIMSWVYRKDVNKV